MRPLLCFAATGLLWFTGVVPAMTQGFDAAPQTRLRPIGEPSAVDQYRSDGPNRSSQSVIRQASSSNAVPRASFTPMAYQETSHVRQTAAMQNFELPPGMGPTGNAPVNNGPVNNGPPNNAPVNNAPVNNAPNFNGSTFNGGVPGQSFPPPSQSLPPVVAAPRSLPPASSRPATNPPPTNAFQGRTIPSPSDLTPLPPPQLSSGFATVDNCNCVSGPSSYSAASGIGCGQVGYQAPLGYGPATGLVTPPPTGAITPQNGFVPLGQTNLNQPSLGQPNIGGPPVLAPATAGPAGALIDFGQSQNVVQVGPGLFGQPKAYVPGQGVRNWLRYFTP